MIWFLLALLGYACLRLHDRYPPLVNLLISLCGNAGRYHGLIMLLIGLSLFGIAFFYNIPRSVLLWDHYPWLYSVANVAIFVACFFTVSIWHPTNLRVWVASPFAGALFIWALAHLLVNGDSTSLLMFSVFALVSFMEWLTPRDRVYAKSVAISNDVAVGVLSLAFYALLLWGHEYYSGVVVLW